MNEVWKDIYFVENGIEYDYRKLYQVSSLGRIKSLGNGNSKNSNWNKERILIPQKDKDGYLKIVLSFKGKTKYLFVHRLVAFMFIPNDNSEKTIVNHKDENPENNCVENLEWCTIKYNNNYGNRNKKLSTSKTRENNGMWNKGRCVCELTETLEVMNIYKNSREASESTNIHYQNILYSCKNKTTGKHGTWRYVEDVPKEQLLNYIIEFKQIEI